MYIAKVIIIMRIIYHYEYRTFKQHCPAHISLRVNENGTALVVKSVSFDHNHPVSQV